ncbi:MAG: cell division protein FtsB [Pseudomonadota bacterium]|nr:MAG: cell division protein FtsB [Pseudomonadota bacterium]
MKILAIILGILIVLIQYPLWLGKGGWLQVWKAERQVEAQKQLNDAMQARNDSLAAEVADLKQGLEAVEERARYELGFVKKDEVFFQIVESKKDPHAPAR